MRILIAAWIAALEAAAIAQPETAEALYAEGQAAYDRADYATAIEKWQASYQLSREPLLIFNVAQAQRQSGDCPHALATYRQFVAADPDPTSEQHVLALDFERELEARCGALPRVVQPDPRPETGDRLRLSVPEHRGRSLRVAGLGIGGAGAVSITVGLVLGHHGASIGDEVTAACATSCDWNALRDKDAAGRRDVTIGHVLDAAGAAAIVTGTITYYLGWQHGAITIVPAGREGGIATWSGSW